MSTPFPLITDWETRGLDWQYVRNSKIGAFIIPAGGEVQLPYAEYTYKYPEGVLCYITAGFDHPACGVRMEWSPNFDTEDRFTVNNLMSLDQPENLLYGMLPPKTFPGLYAIRVPSFWEWKDWLRLYVINTDTVDHRCLGFGYMLAVLLAPRPKEPIVALKELQLVFEMYPEFREQMRGKMTEQAERLIKALNRHRVLEVEE